MSESNLCFSNKYLDVENELVYLINQTQLFALPKSLEKKKRKGYIGNKSICIPTTEFNFGVSKENAYQFYQTLFSSTNFVKLSKDDGIEVYQTYENVCISNRVANNSSWKYKWFKLFLCFWNPNDRSQLLGPPFRHLITDIPAPPPQAQRHFNIIRFVTGATTTYDLAICSLQGEKFYSTDANYKPDNQDSESANYKNNNAPSLIGFKCQKNKNISLYN